MQGKQYGDDPDLDQPYLPGLAMSHMVDAGIEYEYDKLEEKDQ